MTRSLCRRAAAGGAALAATLWIAVGGATAQVPDVPAPPPGTSTTVPATSPPSPPEDSAPSVPDPGQPPSAPTTVPPGTPGTPDPKPAPPAPGAATTTTVAPKAASSRTPPSKAANLAQPELSIDLSEIDDLRRQARGKGPRPLQPDYGFDSSLPFEPGDEELGAGTEAEELGAGEEHDSRVRALAAIGGGLLALVLMGAAVSVLSQARRQPPLGSAG